MLGGGEDSTLFSDDLQRLVANLAEISDKINRGEGTLGALINDRTLYEGMEDVVAGANDSKFARWLLRRYQKRGIKVEEQQPRTDDTGNGAASRPQR